MEPVWACPGVCGRCQRLKTAACLPACSEQVVALPYVAQSPELLSGTSSGDGQCVALVKRAAHAPPTSFWRRGALVKGNARLQPGTVIATFDPIGRYGNHTNGTSHAAIYLGQDANGIRVLDQWVETRGHKPWHRPASERTIRFGATHDHAVNNADNYYVVD